jgi:hypothetical protein
MASTNVEEYPLDIKGNPMKDDFITMNPEVKLYPQVNNLVREVGQKEASKLLWCFFLLYDLRSFIDQKMTYYEKKGVIQKNFHPIAWEEYDELAAFYKNKILINDDVLYYLMLRERFEQSLQDTDSKGKLNVKSKLEEKQALDEFKAKAFNVINNIKLIRTQGKEQPGLLAARIIE